jgi:hypothetical protein
MESQGHGNGELRFFVVEDNGSADRRGAATRMATARAALREAQQAEWEERTRLSRARVEGLTATHAALLQARQAQSQAAVATVEDLARRAAWLRQAIALGDDGLARQRQFIEKLRRELAEIGE